MKAISSDIRQQHSKKWSLITVDITKHTRDLLGHDRTTLLGYTIVGATLCSVETKR